MKTPVRRLGPLVVLLPAAFAAGSVAAIEPETELWPRVDGAVKSRFLMGVGWVIIVHVYFTRPTDRGIV